MFGSSPGPVQPGERATRNDPSSRIPRCNTERETRRRRQQRNGDGIRTFQSGSRLPREYGTSVGVAMFVLWADVGWERGEGAESHSTFQTAVPGGGAFQAAERSFRSVVCFRRVCFRSVGRSVESAGEKSRVESERVKKGIDG